MRPLRAAAESVLTWWSAPICSVIFSPISARPVPALIGIAPSANLNQAHLPVAVPEPVHGSAPDIYGKISPTRVATVWAGAMMLDFLGNGDERYHHAAHNGILAAIEQVICQRAETPDMKGSASTPTGQRRYLPKPFWRNCPSRSPVARRLPRATKAR